jgi:hypothetical protein
MNDRIPLGHLDRNTSVANIQVCIEIDNDDDDDDDVTITAIVGNDFDAHSMAKSSLGPKMPTLDESTSWDKSSFDVFRPKRKKVHAVVECRKVRQHCHGGFLYVKWPKKGG